MAPRNRLALVPLLLAMACPAMAEDTADCFTAIYALNDGRLDDAINHYTRCIETGELTERNLIVAYNDRGNAYGKKAEYDRALADFNTVIALNPRDPDAFYNRGLTHKRLANLAQAIEDYSKAIHLNPKYSKAYNNRGSILGEQGEYNHAITDFNHAIFLNNRDASAYFNRGLAYYSTGDYKQAIADLEKAIELNPKYIKAYENLAWLRATCPELHFRDGIMAVALARKARFLRPHGTTELFDILAAAYASSGSYEQAVRYQQLAIERATPGEKQQLEARMELYRNGSVFEDTGGNRFLASS